MATYRLALIGFGTVGQGLVQILLNKRQLLQTKYDFDWQIVAICDQKKGSVFSPEGLDAEQILTLTNEQKPLTEYKNLTQQPVETGWDAIQTIKQSNADIICEMTFTDIQTGQPAATHCQTAFQSRKHVVTTNKGPVVVDYNSLKTQAEQHQCFWGIEGTVLSGTPVIKLLQEQLQGLTIHSISGIFNGTTNYILTRMAEGIDYSAALKEAQQLGYAEANPTADVEGHDVLAKVVILGNVLMGGQLHIDNVPCQGISQLTLDDIQQAQAAHHTWKLIGQIKQNGSHTEAKVSPRKLPNSHPLANIQGAVNAINIETDLLGHVTLTGPGAGKLETGYALLSDLLACHKHTLHSTQTEALL